MSELVLELPKFKVEPTAVEPSKMMIVSHPKTGKTTLLAELPHVLIIDLEGGTKGYKCTKIDVRKLSIESGVPMYSIVGQIAIKIRKEIESTGTYPYDFIAIDTTTALESIANDLAVSRYKASAVGKSWTGNVITNLPQGAGEGHLREAFGDIYMAFDGLAGKCLILSSHAKKSSINKNGEDLSAKDVELRGKNKTITVGDMDCTGFLSRNKNYIENTLSFKTSETDLVTGSRFDYLAGKEFIISKKEGDTLNTFWELVFPSIKK